MKKPIFLLFLIIVVLFIGCGQKENTQQQISFFYPRKEITYGSEDALFSCEERESYGLSHKELIEQYLAGPLDEKFHDPFPEDTTVSLIQSEKNTCTVVLSDGYASFSGLQLSIANACLAKTVMQLTGCETVVISCETKTLNGEQSLVITDQMLILFDSSTGTGSLTPTETDFSQ